MTKAKGSANEWKKYGKTWQEFRSNGLAKVGTIVEVKGKQYLIGDINDCCGVCDDCVAFCGDSIVLRYKEIKLS